jgi:hypothetical protein
MLKTTMLVAAAALVLVVYPLLLSIEHGGRLILSLATLGMTLYAVGAWSHARQRLGPLLMGAVIGYTLLAASPVDLRLSHEGRIGMDVRTILNGRPNARGWVLIGLRKAVLGSCEAGPSAPPYAVVVTF